MIRMFRVSLHRARPQWNGKELGEVRLSLSERPYHQRHLQPCILLPNHPWAHDHTARSASGPIHPKQSNSRALPLNLWLTRQLLKLQPPDKDKENDLNLSQGEPVTNAVPRPAKESEDIAPYARNGILLGAEFLIHPALGGKMARRVENFGIGSPNLFRRIDHADGCHVSRVASPEGARTHAGR
jgi:hypothetical protein